MSYRTMAEIKAANAAGGENWFSPDAMRFFKTKVHPTVYLGCYFITRETEPSGLSAYSVRQSHEDGSISTVGEFFAYATKEEAKRALYLHHVPALYQEKDNG